MLSREREKRCFVDCLEEGMRRTDERCPQRTQAPSEWRSSWEKAREQLARHGLDLEQVLRMLEGARTAVRGGEASTPLRHEFTAVEERELEARATLLARTMEEKPCRT